MNESCYLLEVDPSTTTQTDEHTSFIGGKPCFPAGTVLPRCRLCETPLTFFFQVAFPESHFWNGLSLAVFAGVDCAHMDYVIPPMLEGPLRGIDIPQGFLEDYQVNFRLLVFETAQAHPIQDYQERIRFAAWRLIPGDAKKARVNKIGGEPDWVLEDEAPAAYGGKMAMRFLMQTVEGFDYEILEGAPAQKHIFDLSDKIPGYRPSPIYDLFAANALYFFGTEKRDQPSVYIIPQSD